jgi:hypothetical protein
MKLIEQLSVQGPAVGQAIEEGQEAFAGAKRRVRWLEESYRYTVREFRTRWTLRIIAAVVATLGLGAWLFSAYFAMAEYLSPSASAFLLGSILMVSGIVCVIFSLRRVRTRL